MYKAVHETCTLVSSDLDARTRKSIRTGSIEGELMYSHGSFSPGDTSVSNAEITFLSKLHGCQVICRTYRPMTYYALVIILC